jgi:PAS domain S-box-containing protein
MGEFDHCMVATFSSDGIISSISSRIEEITGFPSLEVVGKPITQILSDRSVFEVLHMIQSARQNGFWEGDVVHRHRDGRSLVARGGVLCLSGGEKQNSSYLMISTHQQAPERGSAVDLALSEVASKLRTFAHELNNPLAVIMGFAQLILMNSGSDSKVRTDMERLYSEMQRVIQVVEKMHGYAYSLQDDAPQQLSRKTS